MRLSIITPYYNTLEYTKELAKVLEPQLTDEIEWLIIDDGCNEELESRFAKVWYVQNPEICKLTFTIPWWNDQAEQYYWNQMQSKWFLEIYNDDWIMKWDILRIKSYYEWLDDTYVLY